MGHQVAHHFCHWFPVRFYAMFVFVGPITNIHYSYSQSAGTFCGVIGDLSMTVGISVCVYF